LSKHTQNTDNQIVTTLAYRLITAKA